MLGQIQAPDDKTSLHLRVDADRPALSQDAALHRSTRFLWTGLGLAVVMLIGVSAWALHPLASHAPAEPPLVASEVAFMPSTLPLHVPASVPEVQQRLEQQPPTEVDVDGVAQESHWLKAMYLASMDGPGEEWPEGMEKIYRVTDHRAMLGEEMLVRLHEAPSIFSRSSPVMGAGGAVLERPKVKLELEYEPPSPPPPPTGTGGGGGGGDGGDDIHMRRITGPEALDLVDNWIARTQVYVTSGQFGEEAVAAVHRKSLAALEKFLAFINSSRVVRKGKKPFFVALYAPDEETVLELAGGWGYWTGLHEGALMISHLQSSPFELDDKDSSADTKMRMGLAFMARDLDLELEMALEFPEDDSRRLRET